MNNVIILGASGNIAKHVIDILVKRDDINLTRSYSTRWKHWSISIEGRYSKVSRQVFWLDSS
jgi:saccharopine dehydrogenase-like NADP-dependent oxidoreductase